MNKKVWQAVQDRSEGYCEYPTDHGKCRGNDRVQEHHVFGKYNRKRLEMPETIYNLCDYHHLNSTTGVHFNKANRLFLEEAAKENLMNVGWSKEKIIREIYGDSKGVGEVYIEKYKTKGGIKMISLIIPGEPVAKGRPRFGNGHVRTPEKTVNYESLVKELFIVSRQDKLEGMLKVKIDCYFGIPKKTSKVKTIKMVNTEIRPVKRPDTDNVAKICLDALNNLAYKDDSQVVSLLINKWYGNEPRVEILIEVV